MVKDKFKTRSLAEKKTDIQEIHKDINKDTTQVCLLPKLKSTQI